MDVQANVEEQGRLSRALLAAADAGQDLDEDAALRLAELVLALVEWKARGGFDPHDWSAVLAHGEP
tara:strand:+ start:6536 stop:6733 length:198 start_codon:yes stop_codon:yes gene_type:complete